MGSRKEGKKKEEIKVEERKIQCVKLNFWNKKNSNKYSWKFYKPFLFMQRRHNLYATSSKLS